MLGLSAETFTIPLDPGRYLVYAPLRRAAFVANSTVVNLMADIEFGIPPEKCPICGALGAKFVEVA